MQRQNRYILLLCDNAPSHSHNPADYPHVGIEYLAPNLTAWVQPMDGGIIRCFKAMYKREFVQLAIERDYQGIDDIYKIDQLQAMRIASKAWSLVSSQTIANCWRHVGICPPYYFPPSPSAPFPTGDPAPVSIYDQMLACLKCVQSIFRDTLSALDETLLTKHEWTDQETVSQVIAERDLALGIYHEDEDDD